LKAACPPAVEVTTPGLGQRNTVRLPVGVDKDSLYFYQFLSVVSLSFFALLFVFGFKPYGSPFFVNFVCSLGLVTDR